jgi:hypothetical protein
MYLGPVKPPPGPVGWGALIVMAIFSLPFVAVFLFFIVGCCVYAARWVCQLIGG